MTDGTLEHGERAREPDERETEGDGSLVVALRVETMARIDLDRVPEAFGDGTLDWLGQPAGQDATGLVRYLCDLELRVSPDRRSAFRKSAIISLGTPVRDGARWVIPIEWRAATMAPLFPVFAGRLVVSADRVTLDGHYAPPFGIVGYVLDRGVMGIAARGTAHWFLGKAAAALAG